MANSSADLESASKYSEKSKDDVLVGVVPAVLPSGERKTTVKRALKSRHMQLMLVFMCMYFYSSRCAYDTGNAAPLVALLEQVSSVSWPLLHVIVLVNG